jgi:hypothetical protein
MPGWIMIFASITFKNGIRGLLHITVRLPEDTTSHFRIKIPHHAS